MHSANADKETPLLNIHDLTVSLCQGESVFPVIESFDLEVKKKQIIGLVGESGSGKSVLCMSAMGLLDTNWRTQGQISINGLGLADLSKKEMEKVRGHEAAMIFQDASASLNPVAKIGKQLSETIRRLQGVDAKEAEKIAIDLLVSVGIPEPERRYNEYPFQLSGGQNQRVMIALALAGKPKVLFADEPTTALDVTVQAQILELIKRLTQEAEMGVVFVSHDLGVIANICTDIAVMYAGRIVEQGPAHLILSQPKHPYTQGLINSMPSKQVGQTYYIKGKVPAVTNRPKGCAFASRCSQKIEACEKNVPELTLGKDGLAANACFNPIEFTPIKSYRVPQVQLDTLIPAKPLLALNSASCDYQIRVKAKYLSKKAIFRAVNSVSLEIGEGESLALIGESGSGKSSISKLILGIESATTGSVTFKGEPVPKVGDPDYKDFSRNVQLIPQSPFLALDPRIKIGDQIAEPIFIHALVPAADIKSKVLELMDSVGLSKDFYARYPHELSGGQLQRIVIARALALKPKLLICDEPTSALDVSVQGQIIELLNKLRQRYKLALLFITHDLRVIRSLCDNVTVMFAGQIVEQATTDDLFLEQGHPYTRDLLAAAPDVDVSMKIPATNLTSDFPKKGCKYYWRCSKRSELCAKIDPPLVRVGAKQAYSLCHHIEGQ
ncbi:ABC transporter, ATP-binding protein [Marinomonas sp. MED121]|uniref:dipeptide ABC transporter ATP-binding protein n=1 Tax=Marinomonas sp. MED121 TaxID=314277 RepID=UPI0000691218|nr:dipeptide ABC transporter ATP-binding protein [Marinomonas sp. MED121]EAQ67758.1 ABC transporter, ATP-binding protein [Marinomonas sp. MED121]